MPKKEEMSFASHRPIFKRKKIMKILWVDVETSGLDPNRHSLIQLSGIVTFDINFLYSFFKQCGDGYLGSFIQGRIDLMVLATIAYQKGKILPVDEKGKIRFKLQYICKALGIPLEGAHDAMTDINATRLAIIKLLEGDTK